MEPRTESNRYLARPILGLASLVLLAYWSLDVITVLLLSDLAGLEKVR